MQDLLLNTTTFDLALDANNNLVRGESTAQHQALLLLSNKGEWRLSPMVGIGIKAFLKDEDANLLLPAVKEGFEKDGMVVNSLDYDGTKVIADATYKYS